MRAYEKLHVLSLIVSAIAMAVMVGADFPFNIFVMLLGPTVLGAGIIAFTLVYLFLLISCILPVSWDAKTYAQIMTSIGGLVAGVWFICRFAPDDMVSVRPLCLLGVAIAIFSLWGWPKPRRGSVYWRIGQFFLEGEWLPQRDARSPYEW